VRKAPEIILFLSLSSCGPLNCAFPIIYHFQKKMMDEEEPKGIFIFLSFIREGVDE